MPFRLHIRTTSYSASGLLQLDPATLTLPHEQEAAGFARQWLQGEEQFTVQTSGSTGAPKPIALSRVHMQASARLTLEALGLDSGDPALLCMNPAYIGGKMMVVRAIEGALPLYLLPPSANPFPELLALGVQPLFTALVPLQLQAILADAQSLRLLQDMKAVIIGGAPVSPALEEALQQVKAPLYSTYGMTETVSHIALRRLNGPQRQEYFVALPQIGLETDERGCLRISGPVTPKPVQTNDVVELLDSRRFRWLGRADNIINSGGIKVQAERVEAETQRCLASLGLSRRLLAGPLPDEQLGQKVALLLEGDRLESSVEKGLLRCLSNALPPYWAPKQILYVARLVESANGKIMRHASWQQL
ncbi:AMP-binding protein [Cesiribacter andamanensis]|uniref:2-succinylbenzoate--CoA ligase n=1 Tax=Cesiribacter andamanensis AMV16 TaxID=1279009 RepID=M7N2N0_9BACT|nr:AMP-binding protein [Cesiribacter andamanensis]EMR02928.1 2-succinylbenzoate--CoA ligase [Cesiribacter andamanensis AMV16]